MTTLPPLPAGFTHSRDALQRVAVHVVARARHQVTGRFGLRVTPGGFGTPTFGDDVRRVRVSGASLVIEEAGRSGARSSAQAIDGASLRSLAATAEVDLDADLDVGSDTPSLGDPDEALVVDPASAEVLAAWYAVTSAALDAVVDGSRPGAGPSVTQLWPEHFDVAIDIAYDAAAAAERRANLGGSPGDEFAPGPYLYVGPWTADRPGDPEFWNAPFGAVLGYDEVRSSADPVAAATAFFERGLELLGGRRDS